jgi:hypothetical protein
VYIALASCSTAAKRKFLSITGEIRKRLDCQLLSMGRWTLNDGRWAFVFGCLPHNRPHGNFDDFVCPRTAGHFLPLPVASTLCFNDRLVEKIGEIIDVLVGSQDNVAAASAIATIWPAFGHKFFSPKTDAPASTLSGLRENFDPINEHAFSALLVKALKR